ncbi:MAG: hypothetical protein KC777_16810 [Cyanobacteria bacterium HKST-UBA02]|nr:hypothetical protein [Cyanobacteria bacterium HKST-UBA02]
MRFYSGNSRKQRGSAITLTAVLAFALVILGLGYLAFLMYMGGQNETKNACDSGALNTGKRALDDVFVMTNPLGCFFDVTNDKDHTSNDGKVNLRRINRVWAEALLIALNAESMQSEGQGGSSNSSAQSANSEAKSLSDNLASKLSDPSNLYGFFSEIAEQNSVRMLGIGAGVKVKPGAGWETSFMERTKESNVTLPGGSAGISLPPGSSLAGNYVTPTTRTPAPSGSNGLTFLKGYTALQKQGQTFWQVPYLFDEKPHMVSRYKFIEDKSNPPWNTAVPNAFSCDSEGMQTGSVGQHAKGWVLTNPRETFRMCMPHTYMHIHIDTMKAKWIFYPTGVIPFPTQNAADQNYGFVPEFQTSSASPGGLNCSNVTGYATMGLEVVGRSLDAVMFQMPGGNDSQIVNDMTARINQMISKVGKKLSSSDLHAALSDPSTTLSLAAGVKDFYLVSPDGETVKVYPSAAVAAAAPWIATMINKDPDGTDKTFSAGPFPGNPLFFVNPTPIPFCEPVPFPVSHGWQLYYKDLKWRPGTGYSGNLGEVTVKRWTENHTYGICTPIL